MPKKILVLNGSPKRNLSATMNITNAFLEGLNSDNDFDIEIINLRDLNIKPCMGCLSCWGKFEGSCVIKDDDLEMIKNKILSADIFIESFPLYYFGMPGELKVLTDRLLAMMNTYRGYDAPTDGSSLHGLRYKSDSDKKFIVISSCAYTEVDLVYKSLKCELDFIAGENSYTPIFVPQLKTLIDLKNQAKIDRFLKKYKDAGIEFKNEGKLSEETIANLKKPPFSSGAYRIFLDNFWNSEKS